MSPGREIAKIVVVGTAEGTSGYKYFVARYTANGARDSAFGINGYQTSPLTTPGANTAGRAVAIYPPGTQDAGKILVVSEVTDTAMGGIHEILLTRYAKDGTLDDTFGGTGVIEVTSPTGSGDHMPVSVAIDSRSSFVSRRWWTSSSQ